MTLFRCSASGTAPSGRAWSFSIGVSSSASLSTVEADWATNMGDAWTDGTHGLQTLFPTDTVLTLFRTYQLAVFTISGVDHLRVVAVAQDPTTKAGTSTNASLPDQNAVLVSLRSTTPGREGRGRLHLPAPDETLVTAGELSSVAATRVSTAIEAMRAAMVASGPIPVVITENKTLIGTPVGTTHPIVLVETDRVVRTQRVRVKGRRAVYA